MNCNKPKGRGDLLFLRFPSLNTQLLLRLEELGFEEDAYITCLKKMPFKGPKVFQIGDSIFSLTRDIASAVTIKLSTSSN